MYFIVALESEEIILITLIVFMFFNILLQLGVKNIYF